MKIIKPYYQIISSVNIDDLLQKIERAGRTCYKSEDKITSSSAEKFIKMLIDRGHESVLEHYSISVLFVCDRGISHELVRHRIASFSQESTRYCNYSKDKHGNQITYIQPPWVSDKEVETFLKVNEFNWCEISPASMQFLLICRETEDTYTALIKNGWKPEQARGVLPNCLKTEIVVTANIREWRTIFKQRTSEKKQDEMFEAEDDMRILGTFLAITKSE